MEFEGYVSRIVYQNSENGYSVIALELTGQAAEEAGEEQVAVGTFPGIEKGDFIKITGEWVKHSSYGMQIKASSFSRAVPADIEAIKKYLSSGAIKGIGIKMAERIVEKFGEDSLRVIEEEPATLAKVKGISDKKAAEIAQAASEKKNLRDAMMFLQQYGISLNMAVKIYNTYELEIYDLMRNNPYKLATDIEGIGFKTADAIAERAGISKNSEFRIKAGIIYVLKQAGGSGHTYLPKEVLKNAAAEMLEVSDEEIEKNLMDLQISRQLISKNVRQPGGTEVTQVYETMLYYMELNVADRLLSLSLEDSSGAGEAERLLADFERSCGMS
ncbi:MAG: ATP-dependent RecD-like DNA helicase, partial [Lachnospiraceae bacterium]|nr:ATP-dependent RecD-like DNA helicase [Lachnospiraceae bacterium]